MKLSRLFWKLFVAFWLASAFSFLIGASLLTLTQSDLTAAGAHHELVSALGEILANDGVNAARPLLDEERRSDGPLALYDGAKAFVAGNPHVQVGRNDMRLTSPDGRAYFLAVDRPLAAGMGRTLPLLIGTFVSLLFSAAVAWYLAQPLTHLSRGFRAVAAGQLATRVLPQVGGRRDEIANLAYEFDGMAAQLQQLWEAQQRLLHDVSHELRSPLARLHVAIGLMRQSANPQPALLARVEREAERLESLLSELLTLARLKAGRPTASAEKVDLLDLLTAIVDDANFEAQPRGCRVVLDADASFVTLAEGELLYRAFENVIRNAVRHSPSGGEVLVRARVRGDHFRVEITDEGPGVPAEACEEIFEPFKRLDRESEGAGGFGLGLALARQAVEHHAGSVVAANRQDGTGLCVTIDVPRSSRP